MIAVGEVFVTEQPYPILIIFRNGFAKKGWIPRGVGETVRTVGVVNIGANWRVRG